MKAPDERCGATLVGRLRAEGSRGRPVVRRSGAMRRPATAGTSGVLMQSHTATPKATKACGETCVAVSASRRMCRCEPG